jgi:hypothetical protein
LGGYSAIAAVIAYLVDRDVVNDGLVVNVGDVRHVADVIHRAVVKEGPVLPTSAFIAGTGVAESIVDAAVETDMRAPVPLIPGERVAAPTPVTRSP